MATSDKPITIYGALAANLAIAVTKFLAAAATGSSAMLSEGIHSVADTGNQVLLLMGIRRGRKAADAEHPFGHGRELYFWTLIVAIILFGLGGGMSVFEGITHLLHPSPMGDPKWNYVVLAAAFVFEGASFLIALREMLRRKGRQGLLQAVHLSKDPTVFVVLYEDAAALAGIVVAFLGIFVGHRTGSLLADGIASIVIGAILAVVAVLLAWETKGLLIGEGLEGSAVEEIRRLATADPAVVEAGSPLTMYLGPEEVLLNLELQFGDRLSSAEIAAAIDGVEHRVRERFPQIRRIFIEAESLRRGAGAAVGVAPGLPRGCGPRRAAP